MTDFAAALRADRRSGWSLVSSSLRDLGILGSDAKELRRLIRHHLKVIKAAAKAKKSHRRGRPPTGVRPTRLKPKRTQEQMRRDCSRGRGIALNKMGWKKHGGREAFYKYCAARKAAIRQERLRVELMRAQQAGPQRP